MSLRFSILSISYCILVFVFFGCVSKKIEITNDYIINGNWSRENEHAWANSIAISRMKVRQVSNINPLSNLSQSEILGKLEVDSTFIYSTNVRLKEGENYDNKKIYFNRDNGFYWVTGGPNNLQRVKTIGKLQNGYWYKFSSLGTIEIQFIFIYLDNAGKIHRFNVAHLNY